MIIKEKVFSLKEKKKQYYKIKYILCKPLKRYIFISSML